MSGSERMGPIDLRVSEVMPESPTMKTNFSQRMRSMSPDSSASNHSFAREQAARKASARRVLPPPGSPKTSRAIGPL